LGKNPGSQTSSFDDRLYFGVLFLFSLTVFFTRLGSNGMADFDDCFYAEKAKEILQNHQWWILTFDHSPAFENPPFYMWLAALSYKLFGISVYAAKFPSALMGTLGVLLVFSLGRTLFNPWVGRYAAFILATTDPFFKYVRHAMVDVTLTFFVISALYCLLLALRKNPAYFILWGFCIGLAVLTKSVLGLFPLLISGLFILATSQWKKIGNGYFLAGCLIVLVLGGSWYGVEYASFGHDFLKTHFGWLIFQRGFQSQGEPWYHHLSYLKDLAVFDWPWLPLQIWGLFLMLRAGRWKNENILLVLLWIGTFIGVMSCMQSRVLWYIMPSFPALAITAAWALDHFLDGQNKVKVGNSLMGIGLGTVVLLNALPIQLNMDREKDVRTLAPYVKYFAGEGASLVGLREEYYGLNNALMFFSDHAAEPLLNDPRDLKPLFESKKLVLCVAHRGDLAELKADLKEFYPVKFGEDLVLIANQKVDISDVPTGDGPWND
jgi:4-amino-4-deoxy-L-arabinose transferase-like glycosyltransferase